MDPLELKLKRALEREDPPAGFAERVMARVLEETSTAGTAPREAPVRWWPTWLFRPAWRAALAGGLAAVLLLGAGLAYRQRQERLRGEKARAELMLALEIASSKLNRVRQVMVEESRRPQEVRP